MRAAPPEVLKAFAALEGNTNFEKIINHLADSFDQTMTNLLQAEDTVKIHKLQGQGGVLIEILKLHDEAKDQLEEIEQRKKSI